MKNLNDELSLELFVILHKECQMQIEYSFYFEILNRYFASIDNMLDNQLSVSINNQLSEK
jgi:hypothetical protein